jgi:hypothetical protein
MWGYINSWRELLFNKNNNPFNKQIDMQLSGFLDDQFKFICKFIILTYTGALLFLIYFSYSQHQSNMERKVKEKLKNSTLLINNQLERYRTIVKNTAIGINKLQSKVEIYGFINNSAFALAKDKHNNSTIVIQLVDCKTNSIVNAFGEQKSREGACKKINLAAFKGNDFNHVNWGNNEVDNKVYIGTLIKSDTYLYIKLPIKDLIKNEELSDDDIVRIEIIPAIEIVSIEDKKAIIDFDFLSNFENKIAIVAYIGVKEYYNLYLQKLPFYVLLPSIVALILLSYIGVLRKKLAYAAALIEKKIAIESAANQELSLIQQELIKRQSQAMLLARENLATLKGIYDNNAIVVTIQHTKDVLEKVCSILSHGIYMQEEVVKDTVLSTVINSVFQLLGKAIYQMNIQVTEQIPASLTINRDELFIKYTIANIISNLLTNASKKAGYILISAQKQNAEQGNGIHVTIEDNGFCTPTKPHILKGIFQPLKEVEETLISMGWKLTVEHKTYEGNKITLFIPDEENKEEIKNVKEDEYDNVIRLF